MRQPKIESLKAKIAELSAQLTKMVLAEIASKSILKISKNEHLILRAKACLELFSGIDSENVRIGYDMMRDHCLDWKLNEDEAELYKRITLIFDEVDFILDNTKYDSYEDGHFFRRS